MTDISLIYLACPACGVWHTHYEFLSYYIHSSQTWSDGFVDTSSFVPDLRDQIGECKTCGHFFWTQEQTHLSRWEIFTYLENKDDKELNANRLSLLADFTAKHNENTDLPSAKTETYPNEEDDVEVWESMEIEKWLKILNSGLANSGEKELMIRLELWKEINHLIRYRNKLTWRELRYRIVEFSSYTKSRRLTNKLFAGYRNVYAENLKIILKLLHPENSVDDMALSMQIHRTLGDFSKASYLVAQLAKQPDFPKQYLRKAAKKIRLRSRKLYKL